MGGHRNQGPIVVQGAAQARALSKDQPVADTPVVEVVEETEEVVVESYADLDRDTLKSLAEERGLEFPKNIHTDKLVSLLEESDEDEEA